MSPLPTIGHWIDGKTVNSGSRLQDVFNPATGQAYALPTTIKVTAEDLTGTTLETYSLTKTSYDTALNDRVQDAYVPVQFSE